MKYHIRPGIFLENVCGTDLLVATMEARKFCPTVKRINAGGAYYWGLLEEGCEVDAMAKRASEDFGVSEEEVRPGLLTFLSKLKEQNYILED